MKLFLTLIGIAIIVFGSQYYFDTAGTNEVDCPAEPLPSCATTGHNGSYVTVLNNCDYDITVQWEFLAGSDLVRDLAPGEDQRVSSYPVKVTGISCCSEYNRCW